MKEIYDNAFKIYKSHDFSFDEKYEILFSDRFYGQLNFKFYPYANMDYTEYNFFVVMNQHKPYKFHQLRLNTMMEEFKRLVDIEERINKVIE